jgi:hypothetical protein
VSNTIQFLEMWGNNPAMVRGPVNAYAEEVAGLNVGTAQKQALLARDAPALNRLLNGRAEIFCMVSTPDEQLPLKDPDDREDGKDPDTRDEPDKDD